MEQKEKLDKTRNWACIIYPESASQGWRDILYDLKIQYILSPLHDSDINEDGTQKKSHYHLMIMFDNTKTIKQAKEIFDKLGGVGAEKVISLKGMARYMCHLDHPKKALYNIEDVTCGGGVDYLNIISSLTDSRQALKEIHSFLSTSYITSFAELADYALECRPDWYTAISEKYSYFLDKYIKSKYWKERQNI